MKKIIFVFLIIFTAFNLSAESRRSAFGGSAGAGARFSTDFNAIVNSQKTAIADTGMYVYGDFIYLELICGMYFGTAGGSLNYLGTELGLFTKFPFTFSEKITIFPLLGFEFHSALYAKFNGMQFKDKETEFKQFWFKAGAGLDYKVNDYINLRFEALYGIRPKSIGSNELQNGTPMVINEKAGNGFTFRAAIGL